MARPQLMHSVEDGLIIGNIERNREVCSHCGHVTMCVNIHDIILPKPLVPAATMIGYRGGNAELHPVDRLGIGCGCYARFHRQLAHIRDQIMGH